jgi:hypothetical protein
MKNGKKMSARNENQKRKVIADHLMFKNQDYFYAIVEMF